MLHSTPIFVGRKTVGCVKNGVFEKRVRGSQHFLRTPPAIALDVGSLEQAEQAGAKSVAVRDQESGIVYKASTEFIREKGFPLNRGFGEQIALPMEGWVRSKRGGGLPTQIGLFG